MKTEQETLWERSVMNDQKNTGNYEKLQKWDLNPEP
jgi:hypothetical protein